MLFATGLRNVAALSDVTATLNDSPLTVQYAGPQGEFTGLDQLNLLLPRVCSNCATSLINIRVAGQATNALQIAIREN